ncbi:MAG: hypothetical protein C4617_02760 [Candidatus Liberibacter europaeus]|uniref:DUF2336 domain-containing protein n=1 Tax=Candidatus Liberibacter europaeus TaxID=744859 RepID=A0A2T4VY92_9HYPH|nr:hypothetical protein [Candidatus Liberibacter europaeus]PTL86745.1 MAG: hypothetical protein C4617_02760 [Candidatus Liberibacter europaeus]
MSLQSFITWTKKANLQERISVARIVGKTWCAGGFLKKEKDSLILAMMHLLDDPSPSVRLAFSRSIALSNTVPRHIILALSEDHPDVSGTIILHSPILKDSDLFDLIKRGSGLTRVFIASRYKLSHNVAKNLIEIGCLDNIIALLENKSSFLSSELLTNIAERFCHVANVRRLLSLRDDLSLKARYLLMKNICKALCHSDFVNKVIYSHRSQILCAESMRIGIIEIISNVDDVKILRELVKLLQQDAQLTPALLIHSLIMGAIKFISVVLENLSQYNITRISSILSNGGFNVIRALYESIGLDSEISAIFVEATMIWREKFSISATVEPVVIAEKLLLRINEKSMATSLATKELLEMIERIHLYTNRKLVREIAAKSSQLVAA